MSALREVSIIVSNIKTPDVYRAKSYPDNDYDDNGRTELYETPIYKIFIEGTDERGKPVKKEWTALRFMPYWNDPRSPDKRYKSRGWVNSGKHFVAKKAVTYYDPHYEVHNTYSPFGGAIQIDGSFLIHAGPETPTSYGWGAAGCVEIIGNFDDFKRDILRIAGSTEPDLHAGIGKLVKEKKLFVQVDLARPPDIQKARWGEM